MRGGAGTPGVLCVPCFHHAAPPHSLLPGALSQIPPEYPPNPPFSSGKSNSPLSHHRAHPKPGKQQEPNRCWLVPIEASRTSRAPFPALPCWVLEPSPLGGPPAAPLAHQDLAGPVVDGPVAPASPLQEVRSGGGPARVMPQPAPMCRQGAQGLSLLAHPMPRLLGFLGWGP